MLSGMSLGMFTMVAVCQRWTCASPFPYFGLVIWLTIVLLTISLMRLFDSLGKPVREEQLRQMQAKQRDGYS